MTLGIMGAAFGIIKKNNRVKKKKKKAANEKSWRVNKGISGRGGGETNGRNESSEIRRCDVYRQVGGRRSAKNIVGDERAKTRSDQLIMKTETASKSRNIRRK